MIVINWRILGELRRTISSSWRKQLNDTCLSETLDCGHLNVTQSFNVVGSHNVTSLIGHSE